MSIGKAARRFARRLKALEALARDQKLEQVREIIASEFDVDFYRTKYPDVLQHIDPVAHYIADGWREGRDPSPGFSTRSYMERNPDVRRTGINPFYHYLASRRASGVQLLPGVVSSGGGAIRATLRSILSVSPRAARSERQSAGALNGAAYAAFPPRKAGEAIPHYGATFHKTMERARAGMKPIGAGSLEYEVIRVGFDLAYYLMHYADIARAGVDPIQHYIDHGVEEGRDPSPDFSTTHYVARYPDIKGGGANPFYHWLTVGRAEGRIAQPFSEFDGLCSMIRREPADVQETLIRRRRDLRERFEHGVLGEMVKKAAEFEPLIAHTWPDALKTKLSPFHTDQAVAQVVAMHRLHHQAGFRRAKAVVVIPHCRLGGGTRIAGYLADALARIYGPEELVVLRTDLDVMQFPEWFPAGCRHVSLEVNEDEPRGGQGHVLAEFLRSLRPEVVFNVNSRLFWDALRHYGKALSASMALYGYFFCNDKNALGHWAGYPLQKFYRYFDILSAVFTDSYHFADELRARYLVPPDQAGKIVTLESPVAEPPPIAPAPAPLAGRRPQIFWSGRFDRQKRLDLVYALARRMPEANFRLWGEPVLDAGNGLETPPANVTLEGVYADLAELPLAQCDVWLYTSEWDGVPNILIEIATRGVPIVGSLVGGTGEILREGLSWPVSDIEDVGGYQAGVLAVLADPAAARERAVRLRSEVLTRRTPERYRETVRVHLPVGGGGSNGRG